VKNIHYGDIHTKFSTLFDIIKEKVPFINETISLDKFKKENYCKEGDIIFADASEDLKDVGKSIEIVNLNNEKLLSGLHTLLARQINSEIEIGFGGYLFLNDRIRKQIQRESQGAKVLGISATRLSNINIFYPKEKKEQQKITDCLSSLDNVLIAERQLLEIFQDHKKGLLQNLIPREGELAPSFRFKEFEDSGNWVKKSFDELFEIGNGRDYKHLEKGNIPVYGSGGYMHSVNGFLYDGDSVCIGRKGTIDKPMFLTGKFWTVDTLFYTHSFKECIPKYIFYVFQNINWRNHNEAGGVPSLSKSNIYKIIINIPKPQEQQIIADTLSSIDELINAQNQKIKALNLHKKGLMQGLFPTINDEKI
jgi:type I restriction enzyme S subunit